MWSESVAIFDPYNNILGGETVSELTYTFDEMWEELKNRDEQSRKFFTEVEMLAEWRMAKPHWWQFRQRRAWRKAKPKMGGADHA